MRILIVEDEQEIRDFIKKRLKEECYAVDTAADGEEGLMMAQTNDYALIILDNVMPKMIGQEVCVQLRAAGKSMPILILSVKTETTTKINLLNAGADDYLTKPFSPDELLARVKALLRRPLPIKQEIIAIDDLEVDTNRHVVKRGNQEIYLTRKEYTLLVYMLHNQENLLSRSMLMEHVWDTNIDPFSNTIESHILSLRKKIDIEGKNKLIHTIPGRGYKMGLLSTVKK